MKTTITLMLLSYFGTFNCQSQQVLLDENFNSGIPSGWTQWSAEGLIWESGSSMGPDGSNAAMLDHGVPNWTGIPYHAWLQTPFMDLSALGNPLMQFDFSIIRESDYTLWSPQISFWYDTGAGWTYLSSWGDSTSFTSENPDNFVEVKESNSPLDLDSIIWHSIDYNLSQFSLESNIRFSFGGDFPQYGPAFPVSTWGWVMVDNVKIFSNESSATYSESTVDFSIYPNPASKLSMIEFANNSSGEINLTDLKGAIVQTQSFYNTQQVELDLENLRSGTYLLTVNLENGTVVREKLTVN